MKKLAKVFARQVKLGNKKFQDITPQSFQVEVYEVLESMVKSGELSENELNDLLDDK